MGTKQERIYGKGAPFKGAPQRFPGGSCPKLIPPYGSATAKDRREVSKKRAMVEENVNKGD